MPDSTAPALWRMLGILAAVIGLAIATCAREHPAPTEADDTAAPDSPPNPPQTTGRAGLRRSAISEPITIAAPSDLADLLTHLSQEDGPSVH
jgi:hypothetical protein